ncbi:MAG: amino acid ABC transporter permease [Thermoprotei archaeon]|nr:MAG: amino acid ABC transporter permease [Thermoprotei archaeon]
MFNPEVLHYVPVILSGLTYTGLLTIGGVGIGFFLGLLLAFAEVYGPKPLSVLASSIGQIIRGIPLIALFFVIFFGLPEIGINLSPTMSAILGLAIRSAAYQSQIFRSAIESIGIGQWEAALSIGMTRFQAFINVIAPQAIRIAIPSWGNEFTIVLKDTSIAYAIGVTEMFTQAIHVAQVTLDYFTTLAIVALVYFVLTSCVSAVLNKLYTKHRIPGLGGGV